MQYTYITMCHDVAPDGTELAPPYADDGSLTLFDTFEEAYDAAKQASQEELNDLNEDADNGIKFIGIGEKDLITVRRQDTNGKTEWITKRRIYPVEDNK